VLLGDPVDHSLSPVLHNAAFREQRLDLVYLALRVDAADLTGVVTALGASGPWAPT
jgi:shikimate dehydrogenase